ncbi:hypothetical protein M501DRAFT_996720 [Patellaria atrata CBS 101060]|uniref:Uncharacterized protein n=1 Tax=Patellaria atrata CBS 101060 TaxID=1346257 RepID=A0A9P4S6D0_9PEZI|nr:hypothetical protein M501DRAFT_996720 [Patellaria atrata CBS 101060]
MQSTHTSDSSTQSPHALRPQVHVLQASLPPPFRSRSEDSWIEVSSRPSSSSLSSAAEDIVTTGLRVQHDSNARRRRRTRDGSLSHLRRETHGSCAPGSSQDEYEESESDADRLMTSSNEGLHLSPLESRKPVQYASSESNSVTGEYEEDDEDENSTAVEFPRSAGPPGPFTPQPHAFSHPSSNPINRPQVQHSSGSYFNHNHRPTNKASSQRHSYPSHQPNHNPYNAISPSYQADHDAALRASLSTLLSCAAAARSLPKSNRQGAPTLTTPSNRLDPTSLGMVPESVALGAAPTTRLTSPPTNPSSRSTSHEQGKRKAAATRSSSKERRVLQKKVRGSYIGQNTEEISPTLLTWVVSAGVVVLVSALSFSAGYVIGKETGRSEVLGVAGGTVEAGSCAREAGRGLGLKRLRFGSGTGNVRV